MKILVCGSRDFMDGRRVKKALVKAQERFGKLHLIHGAARGADSLAASAAAQLGIPVSAYPADWDRHGRAAGHLRNLQMLHEGAPDLVLAFYSGQHRSTGTKNMVTIAQKAGVDVVEVFPGEPARFPEN